MLIGGWLSADGLLSRSPNHASDFRCAPSAVALCMYVIYLGTAYASEPVPHSDNQPREYPSSPSEEPSKPSGPSKAVQCRVCCRNQGKAGFYCVVCYRNSYLARQTNKLLCEIICSKTTFFLMPVWTYTCAPPFRRACSCCLNAVVPCMHTFQVIVGSSTRCLYLFKLYIHL